MAFDGNQYRKKVLAPLAQSGDRSFGDAFAIFDLPLEEDDQGRIERQVADVVGFWQKERQRPKYRGLVEALLGEEARLRAAVVDVAGRAAAREAAARGRAEDDRERLARLDGAVALLVREFGGVPTSRVPRLRELARRGGISDAEVDARLAGERLIDDGGDTAEALAPAVRRQIAAALTELAAARGEPTSGQTLFTFLGLPPTASAADIEGRRDALARRNRQRQHDREMTLTGDVLAYVELHLLQHDRAIYLNGLVEDAKDAVRDDVHAACLLSDRLSAVEFERFTRQLVTGGLTGEAARRAVAALAQEVGAPVETGAAVDYIACASCGSAEPDDGREACRRCGAALHQTCPVCSARVPVDVLSCPSCRADFRAVGAAREALAEAERELRSGRPVAARQAATAALAGVPGMDAARQVRLQCDERIREAGRAWSAVRSDVVAQRLYGAMRSLERLGAVAADVEGPDGERVEEALGSLRERLARYEGALDEARGMTGVERERRLLELAAEVADSVRVAAELARTPPAAVARVVAAPHEHGVSVRWPASASPGELAYRVSVALFTGEALRDERTLGTTGETSFEHGAPPVGEAFAYVVSTVRLGSVSPPVRSEPVVVLRDPTHVAAEGRDGSVALRWRAPAGGVVRLERTELRPDGSPGVVRQIQPDEDGYVDTHVRNGTTYVYVVACEARVPVPGLATRSAGVEVRARPRARLQPIRDLQVDGGSGAVRLRARQPGRGEVRIVRLRRDAATPDVGRWLTPDELAAFGEVLPDVGVDDAPVTGVVRYLPVTVQDGDAIAGAVVEHLVVEPVTALQAQDAGSSVTLTWAWPPGCTEALVCWRRDRFPVGPSDPQAERGKTTNSAYEIRAGWRLEGIEPDGAYFFAVFPGARVDGRVVWAPTTSEQARIRVRDAPTAAHWTVRTRRAGLRRRETTVEVRAEGAVPELIVVGKTGEQPPADRYDGVELARIAPAPDTTTAVEVPVETLERPVAVAVFPAEHDEEALVALHGPAPDLVTVTR